MIVCPDVAETRGPPPYSEGVQAELDVDDAPRVERNRVAGPEVNGVSSELARKFVGSSHSRV